MKPHISIPGVLVEAVVARQAVLFAGAGISRSILGLDGSSLKNKIAESIQEDFEDYDATGRTLEQVADDYAALNDKRALVNRFAMAIRQDAAPASSHLAAVKCFRFIVTTNWDLLFERAYQAEKIHHQVLVQDADAPNFNFDNHNLIKLHGSVDRPLTIISTADDYENFPDTHANLLNQVAALLSANTVLFVGYGLADEHIRRLLAGTRIMGGAWGGRAFAVMGAGFSDEVRRRVLETRKIETLPYDAEDFLPELLLRARSRRLAF